MSESLNRRETRDAGETSYFVALGAIILTGAFLRVFYVGAKSYWWDEVVTVKLCHLPFSTFRLWVWRFEGNGSLYYLLLRSWIRFSDHEAWVRLASALPAIACLPIVFLVGRQISGKRTGLAAAFLLSLNVVHIAYAQEARFYSLLVLLCLLSLFFFLRIPERGYGNIIAYAVFSALACYSHFFAVLFLVAQWTSIVAFPRGQLPWKKFISAILFTLVLISPALYYMAFRNKGQLAFLQRPHAKDIINLFYFLTSDGGKFRKPIAAIYLIASAIAVGALLFRRRTRRHFEWGLTVALVCLVLPIAVTFTISFWIPIFFPRYLLICLPGLVLLAARGFVEIGPGWIRTVVVVILLAVSVGCLRWYYSHPKDDWRSLTAYLLKHSQQGDAIVGCPPGAEWPVQYYSGVLTAEKAPRFSYVTKSRLLNDIHDREIKLPRLWIVSWGENSDMRAVQRDIAPEYTLIDDHQFYGSLMLVLYEDPRAQADIRAKNRPPHMTTSEYFP